MPKFHIRPAKPTLEEAQFITSALDSALPRLAAIGSVDQWGTTPFSNREDFLPNQLKLLEVSERYRLTGKADLEHGAIRTFIAEAESESEPGDDGNGKEKVPVGMLAVREEGMSDYVVDSDVAKEDEKRWLPYLFVKALVTDFGAGEERRKGVGAEMLRFAVDYARDRGKKVVYLDCWAGNGGKLVRYYEEQGFVKVGKFVVEKKEGGKWEGMLMRMELVEEE
ncbi:hypothetical protein MFIFM68171_10165 [Madurella fahalii]|uniref:N-acetyltransferase domain-containing protein n=1 Tax=Madurella fahalii TaxID=1157608 RepID=A0ABQ0GQD8_9PEZI